MSEALDKTTALLAALWQRNRPIVEERLAVLDAAAAAAAAGPLPELARREAQGTAHKLAGALGMYGYDEGTRIARQMEQMLDSGAADAARLSSLIAELRASILPNG